MKINAITGALGAAVLGACLGLAHGSAWAWLPAQLCLVLILALLQRSEGRVGRVALYAGLFGVAYGLAGLISMPLSLPDNRGWLFLLPMVAMIALSAGLLAGAAALIQRLPANGPWRWVLAWPAGWTLLEWLQSQGNYALGWLTLGQMQAPHGPLAGLLPMGGVLLGSLAMWVWATLMVALLRQPPRRWPMALAVLGLPAASLLLAQIEWTRAQAPFEVVLVQAQSEPSFGARAEAAHQAAQQWREQLLAMPARHPSALILTPQTSLHVGDDALNQTFLQTLAARLQAEDADLLLGAYVHGRSDEIWNSALALGVSGRQRYDKTILVPFGEFVPQWLAWRTPWGGISLPVPDQDLQRGAGGQTELLLGGHRAAVSICFELAFPAAWHGAAAQADVLINLASDAAHPSLRMAHQTLQLARARALEFGKPMVRTSDWAGSFLLDAHGGLVGQIPPGQSAELRLSVPARAGLTPYARLGSVTVLSLCGLFLLLALLSLRPGAVPALKLHRQTGQVLMAALALLLISVGMMYLMVNTGQMVTEKVRVTNAADAAAYSAGVVEARALNYDAYLNRAMVANELVIAQLVSFASWVQYFARAVDNIPASALTIDFFLKPDLKASLLSVTFGGAKVAITQATGQTAKKLADDFLAAIGPLIEFHDGIIQAMSSSQQLVHANLTAGLAQSRIARDIVSEMDPKLHAELVQTSHGFDAFTREYAKSGGAGDERGRLADVVMRSRYEFTRERNWTIDSPFDFPGARKDGALKKRAGTELVGYDEWRAVDTLELHGRRFGCGFLSLRWCGDVRIPIGWGAVNVNAGGGDAGRGFHGNAYGENGNTASLADSDMREPDNYKFSGLPGVRELANLDPAADPSTGITILVSKKHADTLTSGGAANAKPGGRLGRFDDKPSGGKLVALSRAQVYFDRLAARSDGKTEIGSLYNPYWRVRLIAPTADDRAYAAAQQAGMALP